jgi:hypothetical protein
VGKVRPHKKEVRNMKILKTTLAAAFLILGSQSLLRADSADVSANTSVNADKAVNSDRKDLKKDESAVASDKQGVKSDEKAVTKDTAKVHKAKKRLHKAKKVQKTEDASKEAVKN